ncbi:UNVERIFIED_ORG: hypothetical protein J2X79_004106 [Arthrobacter globiformis]|nr:hypothetical protein [Arthrobacter globiformis]
MNTPNQQTTPSPSSHPATFPPTLPHLLPAFRECFGSSPRQGRGRVRVKATGCEEASSWGR